MNAFSDRLSGDITYSFFFTPKSPTGEKIARSPDLLREKVPAGFKSYLFYDDPSAAEEPVFRDLSTSESFLYSDGLPFPCTRVMLKDAELTTDAVKVSGSSVILTYCHDINIMHLAVSFAFTDADTDSLIYMHHMPTNGVPFRDGNGGEASLADMFKSTVKKLGLSFEEKELVISYSIELNEAYGYDDPELLTSEQSQRLYGILSGDEGYRHVPESLSSERVKTRWSSRDFARLIIFGSNFITLNLNRGERFGHYLKYQERFGSRFYGGLNPYFDLHSSVAGVNHGVFFAIETGMLIRTIADRTMTHHEEYQREHNSSGFNRSIYRTKEYRRELISTLNRVESINMTEMGELEMAVMDNLRIMPIIEKVKDLLELMESELDLLYQNRTNTLVTILTVIGLVASFWGIFYSHVQTFGF